MGRAAYLGVLVVVLITLAPATAAAKSCTFTEGTVPSVNRWVCAKGEFKLRAGARVVAAKRFRKQLAPEVRLLARDLKLKAAPRKRARPGDVVLRIDRGLGRVGKEGYRLAIGRTLAVTARSTTGAFYGGRTLLQLLRDKRVRRGVVTDFPLYEERGLMIDNGRQFFSRRWLEQRIRELASLKLNLLHLHFSDNQGFRLQSDTHPEIVSDPHLTKEDLRALVALARRHHVLIVPELDAPGHMQAALASHPELQLTNAAGQKQPDKLDVTLPAARQCVADLVGEYMPLFRAGFWHTGADEYLGVVSTEQDYDLYPQLEAYADAKYGEGANGKDAVLDFVNFVGEIVRRDGSELRVWSDGIEGGSAVRLPGTRRSSGGRTAPPPRRRS